MSGQASIRFVMEGPQNTKNRQKKRARLVTACDECRIRKVRCHQQKPNEPCEACKASHVKCHFGDRDKYHAERGLTPNATTTNVTTTNGSGKTALPSRRGSLVDGGPKSPRISVNGVGGSGSNASSPMSTTTSLSSTLAGSNGGDGWMEQSRSRSQSLSECSSIPSPKPSFSGKPPNLNRLVDSSIVSQPSFDNSLFDSTRPDYPRPDLLEHLIEIFFDRLGCQLPFLQKDIVLSRIRSFTLPDHVANAIVALAARFSDKVELFGTNSPKWMAGEPFLHKAKLLVVQQLSFPTLDALHTLILIAWAEYGSARDSGLFNFARTASSMLVDLGISTHQALERVEDVQERELLRLTWAGVVRIDLTSAWVTGRSASLQGSQLRTDPFGRSEESSTASPSVLLLDRLTKLYTIRDEVTKMMNSDSARPNDDRPIQNMLISIQSSLSNFYSSLGPHLQFTSENFKRFKSNNQASVFLLLHLMYHGSNALVNWPSLFKEFSRPMPHNISASCSSARSLVSALRIAYTIDRTALLANPFFDVPISVAARAFLAQRTVMIPDQTTIDNSWIESNLGTCMDVLANMAQYWGGADIVGELLEQRGAKFHRRAPSTRNPPDVTRPSILLRRGSGQDHSLRLPLTGIQTASFLRDDCNASTIPPISSRSFEVDSPLSTPRQERVPALLPGPNFTGSTLGASVGPPTESEDLFASFFNQNISSGSGSIDNMSGTHITSNTFTGLGGNQTSTDLSNNRPSSLNDSNGFTSLLAAGMDHALYPPTQW